MIISLWSGPRNVSTALMYSFAQRKDMDVIDEPLYGYYLKVVDPNHPEKNEYYHLLENDDSVVINEIQSRYGNGKNVFLKNMAHHLIDLDTSFLYDYRNIFLIRDPSEMLPSLMKQIPNPVMLDTAYKMQSELFDEIEAKTGKKPLIIDSEQLLINPIEVLKKVCMGLEIPWDPNMLQWEEGPIKEDGPWAPYWYSRVHQSTGFEPYKKKTEKLDPGYDQLLDECNMYYQKLFKYAIRS